MSRLAIVAHWDPRGAAAPHFLQLLDQLSSTFDDVVVASTSVLTDDASQAIRQRASLVTRPNIGQDFGSWHQVLADNGFAQDYDELLLTNDTYVGLLRPLDAMIEEMSTKPADVWGITGSARHGRHIQSYFLYFTRPALHSQAFERFWRGWRPAPTRMATIMAHEIGLSRAFREAGFALGTYFTPTDGERMRAIRRGTRMLRLRHVRWPAVFPTASDAHFDPRRKNDLTQADALNAAIVYADSVFASERMPLVKFDTLRYDSHWLDTEKLLSLCEDAYPGAFAGVREYLRETDPLYPDRPTDNRPPARLSRWTAHRVGYSARPV
ncbi:hypothetical protein NQ166_04425 [Microbacterium sp. zg.Y1090]|uniref:rhamnan synthesis F family protein n=1 Tax=Microbacterium wangruii TaxID=3049073 RepID=UPI00214A8D1A|nr:MULTISPECIES: rhamnan synthesis F family protein [unclassified Microbacterium]MCR2818077.1 hypothetical protein [Microbacterium sp. zg.Y1090]WIM27765.1 rhamnan synthesis F family protein [Microbacterium sp. zg-Y1090]